MITYPQRPDPGIVAANEAGALAILGNDLAAFEAGRFPAAAHRGFYMVTGRQTAALAAYRYALERPRETIVPAIAAAAALWAAAAASGHPIAPDTFGPALSMAAIAGRPEDYRRLAALERPAFTDPDVGAGEKFYRLAELQTAVARGAPDVPARAAALAAALEADPPRRAAYRIDFVAPIALAVAARDAGALERAVADHGARYASAFKRAAVHEIPEALLDLWGLGLLAMARRDGLRALPTGSVWLPVSLLAD